LSASIKTKSNGSCLTEIVALDIEPYLKETVEPYWDRAGVLNKIDFRIGSGRSQPRSHRLR
jgi:hypothetical protein